MRQTRRRIVMDMVCRFYDVTLPLGPSVPAWPGDPLVSIQPALTIEQDGVRVSRLALGSHSGTHIDAPAHLLAGGKDVSELDISALIGPALVLYLPSAAVITVSEMISALHACYGGLAHPPSRLLLKTSNSDRGILVGDFTAHYVALTTAAAGWLVEQGVVLVGIDALSVDPLDDVACSVHRVLLAHDIVILEGLDLRQVPPGPYDLLCLPLRIPGADGAPARALLVRRPPGESCAFLGT